MSYFPATHDVIDSGNSTTTLLGAGATFTGTAFDCTSQPIATVSLICFADQASAADGLHLEWSQDNVHWDHNQTTSLMANLCSIISDKVRARYYRVVLVNGSTPQGALRLQCLQSPTNTSGTIRDLDNVVVGLDEAQLTRSVLTGKTVPGSKYTDVITDVYGSLQTVIGGQAADAFGRIRIGNPVSLFDAKFEYDTQPLLFTTSIVGTGTVTKTANESSITLSTGGTGNNAAAINQTIQYIPYEPGKSQQILMTGVVGLQVSNVRADIGYFDDNNGVFFRMDGWPNGTTLNSVTGMCVVQRSKTSGSVVDTVVPQASWNVDKMDGTGPSGVTLDFSKTQIFAIDFQWLGVGRVRFGFFVNGGLIVCHQIQNANAITSPYMATAVLPCRASIKNAASGVIAGTNTMKQICMTVISEGGVDEPVPYHFVAGNKTTSITSGNGTRTPLVTIRPKATFNSLTNRIKIVPDQIDLANTNQAIFWELVYNGTLGGSPSWTSADANSGVEFDVAATSCTNGVVVACGYNGNSGANKITFATEIFSRLPFSIDIAGNQSTYSLCASGIGGTAPSFGSIGWTEVR